MKGTNYPTEQELKDVKRIGDKYDFFDIVSLLKDLWQYDKSVKFQKNDKDWSLELHTGGWSGHEEIIDKLSGTLFWFFYWQKSERGGHYYFNGSMGLIKEEK